MLQNSSGFVCFDTLWHHIQNVMNYSSSQFQIKMTFNSLFRDGFGYSLAMPSLKMLCQ
jgi:hypothetical protein